MATLIPTYESIDYLIYHKLLGSGQAVYVINHAYDKGFISYDEYEKLVDAAERVLGVKVGQGIYAHIND